jgi:hypothetical protein
MHKINKTLHSLLILVCDVNLQGQGYDKAVVSQTAFTFGTFPRGIFFIWVTLENAALKTILTTTVQITSIDYFPGTEYVKLRNHSRS